MSFTGKMFRLTAGKADARRDANLVAPEDVTAIYDVSYAGNEDSYNLLDVYYPKDTQGSLPVIVSVHGGGYVYGTKEVYKFYGMYLAQQGFTVVNFNYHLAPNAKFPTQLMETNMVLEWMVKHAEEYHMDLNNVFMVGDSAGAQMASQYAAIVTNADYAKLFPFTVPQTITIRAIGLNCGMYVLTIVDKDGKVNKMNKALYGDYLGKDFDLSDERLDVLGHITASYPPTYVMTSYYDFLKENAKPMYDFLTDKGIACVQKCYGTEDKKYMAHVCHVNMNLEEAKEINQDECAFFRKYMV